MADLPYRTQNVSIEDEDTGIQANVNASNELQTRDDDANTTLTSIEGDTGNLDVALSTRASETTASNIETNTDNLDVLLSTRATETTLSGIKTKTDGLNFNGNDLLVYDPRVIQAIGSPASASFGERLYTFAGEITLASSAEYNYVLIDNPSGSGVNMRFWRIRLGVLGNVTVIWHLYFDPTVTTNGTAYTPVNTSNGSANTSDVNVYTSPTISARGTVVDTVVGRQGNSPIPFEYSFVVQPNEKALLTLEPSSANNDFTMTFIWSEEAIT